MARKNFPFSNVATAPDPADSGTELIVTAGHGARFPSTPFKAVVCPAGIRPLSTNAEVISVTNVSTDTLTIDREEESSTARSIEVGDDIFAVESAAILDAMDAATAAKLPFTTSGDDRQIFVDYIGGLDDADVDFDVNADFLGTLKKSGNSVYYATGTDVPITDGGTGASTAAGAATNLAAEFGKLLYPVGSIYINATDNTNPATLLGFGTWSAFGQGRAVIGVGQDSQTFTISAVDTGGAEAVTVESNNTLYTGTAVLYDTTSGAIGGLSDNTTYYIIRNSATSFSLATSRAAAVAGTKINLTSAGSGTQTLTATGTSFASEELVGEETHSLIRAEIPSHDHIIAYATGDTGNTNGLVQTVATADSTEGQFTRPSGGGSGTHNNLQPSIAIYMWKRTA